MGPRVQAERGKCKEDLKVQNYHAGEVRSHIFKSTQLHDKVAGRLKHFYQAWAGITDDVEVLKTVKGLKIDFYDNMPPNTTSKVKDSFERNSYDCEILKLLDKGVISEAIRSEGDFVSPIFFVPKKDGSNRMILNLKRLNEYVLYQHFKMDGLPAVKSLMRPDCFMASLDLKDAYYSVPIHDKFRKYLRFSYKNVCYEYTCLPNGLASAPRVFTKLLKPALSHLRKMGHNVIGYIDDLYIQGDTEEECSEAVSATVNLFSELGFLVHNEKSELNPRKQLKFLGFILNSENMTISPSDEKKAKTKSKILEVMNLSLISVRKLAEIIGILVANFPGIEYGPLFYRSLESDKISALKKSHGSFDSKTMLSHESKLELEWWYANVDKAFKCITHGHVQKILSCDASMKGWGAFVGNRKASGLWNANERTHHINYLELLAIEFGLKSLCHDFHHSHIQILCDNSTAVVYLNKMGGIKSSSCNALVKRIWMWCLENNIWISAAHIPGKRNTYADFLSRNVQSNIEWKLNNAVFCELVKIWGLPQIDLFASRNNAQVEKYVSWGPDPSAFAIDAFSLMWGSYFFYAFPPFSLIGKSLQKVEFDQATGIFIAPMWATQTWFVKLMELLIDQPILLPMREDLLILPHNNEEHPLRHSLKLIACLITGKRCDSKAFRNKQSKSFYRLGDQVRNANMHPPFQDGSFFAVKKTVVRLTQLYP